MKRKNILFGTCVAFTIVLIVISLLVEIHQTETTLKKSFPDYAIQYIHPPYGRYTKKVENAIDLPLILWTIDSEDWKNPDAEKICTNVVNRIKDGTIIIFHDNSPEAVKVLERIIVTLKARNFQFLTVSQLYETKQSNIVE